ncbi:MAG TPA: malonate transporter subunit MadL [Cytophagales bacterium]|nr:malonate transporter subunit MadL [Cytophagales bacterium]HCR55027.1 malonate transporter subunit MadL [Cytophagales bacterium]
MKIYGVAILAGCFLAGQLLGSLLGFWMQIPGNMGGVAFAMFMLIMLNEQMRKRGFLMAETENGIAFWNAMYIPIVVAMSATQNVKAALSGGWVAIVVGVLATGLCLLLVPLVSKIGATKDITRSSSNNT